MLPNRVIIITIAPDNAPPLGCKCPRRDNMAPEKTHVCGNLVLGAPSWRSPTIDVGAVDRILICLEGLEGAATLQREA